MSNIIQIDTDFFYASYSSINFDLFLQEIISRYVYFFQSKFFTYVFFSHDYIFSDTILELKPINVIVLIDSSFLSTFFILTTTLTANNRKT